MPQVGDYTIEVSESTNTRTVGDTTHNLYNIAITYNGETIEIDDIVKPYEREDWCATVFKNAKEGLDHPDGPDCCYVNARYRT